MDREGLQETPEDERGWQVWSQETAGQLEPPVGLTSWGGGEAWGPSGMVTAQGGWVGDLSC